MFKLDNAFLEELGLGSLPPAEKNKMLAHIYETLEMRVGMRLAEQMSNEQLDEFESYINRQDEAGALKWLESNFPNYKQVVAEELEKLKSEIRLVAPQIVASAAQQVGTQQTQPQPAQAPQYNQQPFVQPQSGPDSTQYQQPLSPSQTLPQAPMPNQQPQPTAPPTQDYGQPQQPYQPPQDV